MVARQAALHGRPPARPARPAARLRARLHALGAVLAEDFEEHGWRVTVDLALADAQRLASQAGGHPLEALLPKVEREDWQ